MLLHAQGLWQNYTLVCNLILQIYGICFVAVEQPELGNPAVYYVLSYFKLFPFPSLYDLSMKCA